MFKLLQLRNVKSHQRKFLWATINPTNKIIKMLPQNINKALPRKRASKFRKRHQRSENNRKINRKVGA